MGCQKRCKDCGEVKPIDEFHKNNRMADGHINMCKTCANIYQRNRWNKMSPSDRKRYRRSPYPLKKDGFDYYPDIPREKRRESYGAPSIQRLPAMSGKSERILTALFCGSLHYEKIPKPVKQKPVATDRHYNTVRRQAEKKQGVLAI